MRTYVKFTFANKIEVMYERSHVSVKVEPRSTSRLLSTLYILPLFYFRDLNLRALNTSWKTTLRIQKHFPESKTRLGNEHFFWTLGSRGGAVVRALAPNQCGPGSNPGVNAICGLSLLLVFSIAPRGFSPGTPVFPSLQKPTLPNSNSIWNARTRLNEFI